MAPPVSTTSSSSPPSVVNGFFAMGVNACARSYATWFKESETGGSSSLVHREIAVPNQFLAGHRPQDLVGKWARIQVSGFSACAPIQLIEPPVPTTVVEGIPMLLVSAKLEGKTENMWLLTAPYLGDIIDASYSFKKYGEEPVIGKAYKVWVVKWLVKLQSGHKILWRVSTHQGSQVKMVNQPAKAAAKVKVRPQRQSARTVSASIDTVKSEIHAPVAKIQLNKQPIPDVVPKEVVKEKEAPRREEKEEVPLPTTTSSAETEAVTKTLEKLELDDSMDPEKKMDILLRRILSSRDVRRAIEASDKGLYEEIIDRIV